MAVAQTRIVIIVIIVDAQPCVPTAVRPYGASLRFNFSIGSVDPIDSVMAFLFNRRFFSTTGWVFIIFPKTILLPLFRVIADIPDNPLVFPCISNDTIVKSRLPNRFSRGIAVFIDAFGGG